MKLHVESEGAQGACILQTGGRAPDVRAGGDVILDIRLVPQQRERWCWASIGAAMLTYFKGPGTSQQDVVAQMIAPDEDDNVNLRLDEVLHSLGCCSHWSPGRPTFDRVMFEINRGYPLAVRVEWLRGDAHFVLVTGYRAAARAVWVEDSLNGASWQDYDAFPDTYQARGGVWSETIWTNYKGET